MPPPQAVVAQQTNSMRARAAGPQIRKMVCVKKVYQQRGRSSFVRWIVIFLDHHQCAATHTRAPADAAPHPATDPCREGCKRWSDGTPSAGKMSKARRTLASRAPVTITRPGVRSAASAAGAGSATTGRPTSAVGSRRGDLDKMSTPPMADTSAGCSRHPEGSSRGCHGAGVRAARWHDDRRQRVHARTTLFWSGRGPSLASAGVGGGGRRLKAREVIRLGPEN